MRRANRKHGRDHKRCCFDCEDQLESRGIIGAGTPCKIDAERSERRDNNAGGNRRGAPNAAGQPQVARKAVNKVVHSDAKSEGAPDPRWAGELSKLKDLLANQKTAV